MYFTKPHLGRGTLSGFLRCPRNEPPNIAIHYNILMQQDDLPIFAAMGRYCFIQNNFHVFDTITRGRTLHFSTFTLPSFTVTATDSALAFVPAAAVTCSGNVLPASEPLYVT